MFVGGFNSIWEIYEHTFTPINRFYLIAKDYQCKSNNAFIVPEAVTVPLACVPPGLAQHVNVDSATINNSTDIPLFMFCSFSPGTTTH